MVIDISNFNKYKSINEEVNEILSKYLCKCINNSLIETIKIDLIYYMYQKFGRENTPTNFNVIFDYESNNMSIVPSDHETQEFWKSIGLNT